MLMMVCVLRQAKISRNGLVSGSVGLKRLTRILSRPWFSNSGAWRASPCASALRPVRSGSSAATCAEIGARGNMKLSSGRWHVAQPVPLDTTLPAISDWPWNSAAGVISARESSAEAPNSTRPASGLPSVSKVGNFTSCVKRTE